VPGRESASSAFAHRQGVVELSVQHSVQRSEAVSGTASRPAVVVVESLEVEGPYW